MKKFYAKKLIFDKMTACELSHFFLFVCLFGFCLDSAYTGKSTCIPEFLLKLSDTLHIQYRYIEHVHEEVSGKKLLFSKVAAYLT